MIYDLIVRLTYLVVGLFWMDFCFMCVVFALLLSFSFLIDFEDDGRSDGVLVRVCCADDNVRCHY